MSASSDVGRYRLLIMKIELNGVSVFVSVYVSACVRCMFEDGVSLCIKRSYEARQMCTLMQSI